MEQRNKYQQEIVDGYSLEELTNIAKDLAEKNAALSSILMLQNLDQREKCLRQFFRINSELLPTRKKSPGSAESAIPEPDIDGKIHNLVEDVLERLEALSKKTGFPFTQIHANFLSALNAETIEKK